MNKAILAMIITLFFVWLNKQLGLDGHSVIIYFAIITYLNITETK